MSSDLKLSDKLFLGKEELNHLKKSLREDGYHAYIKHAIRGYGIGYTIHDTNQDSFKIIAGSGGGNLSVQPGYAIDRNLNIIENTVTEIDVLTIPPDSLIYFILLTNNTSVIETGILNVDASGVLTGTGTLFTEVLRGMPNFSSKISFPNSTVNTAEYRVASVASDTSAQLNVAANSMTAEVGIEYRIVGTFNRQHIPTAGEKYPLEKNSYSLSISTTDSSDGEYVFSLGTATYDGTTLNIIDQRNRNLLIAGSGGAESDPSQVNALVGLEQVTYGGEKTNYQKNLAKIGWGFRSANGQWTLDTVNQEIIVNAGGGGIWNNTTPFATGDWDGWYVWIKDDGLFLKVYSSVKVGANINLSIEYAATITTTSEIVIVPDAHEVEFLITNTTNPTGIKTEAYPVHQGEAQIEVEAGITHTVYWRHIKGLNSTKWTVLNNGNYLGEAQFDALGVVTGAITTATAGGIFIPILNPLNHEDDKASRSLTNIMAGFNRFDGRILLNNEIQLDGDRVNLIAAGVLNDSPIFQGSNRNIVAATVNGVIGYTGFSKLNQGHNIIFIENDAVNSIENIILYHENAGSVNINRMVLPNGRDLILKPGEIATFIYDETSDPNARWHLQSTSAKPSWTRKNAVVAAAEVVFATGASGGSLNDGNYIFRREGDVIHLMVELEINHANAVAAIPRVLWTIPAATLLDIAPGATNFTTIAGSAMTLLPGGQFHPSWTFFTGGNSIVIDTNDNVAVAAGDNIRQYASFTYQID